MDSPQGLSLANVHAEAAVTAKRAQGALNVDSLPTDAYLHIFGCLDFEIVYDLQFICRRWKALVVEYTRYVRCLTFDGLITVEALVLALRECMVISRTYTGTCFFHISSCGACFRLRLGCK